MQIAYFLNKYPKISETFVHQEISELIRSGRAIQLFSLFRPTQQELDQIQFEEIPEVNYLMAQAKVGAILRAHGYYLVKKPGNYFRLLHFAFKHRRESRLFRLIINIISAARHQDQTDEAQRQELMVHFILAPVFARVIEKHNVRHLHAHFADAASSFAMLIAFLLKIQYSFTAHAYDVFMPQANIEQKITGAAFIITCTEYNKQFWLQKYPWISEQKIQVIYHGINWHRFKREKAPDGLKPVIVTVGRLVVKKGIAYLLNACLELKKRGVPFECRIIGDGPERARLELFTKIHHLESEVVFKGAIPPQQIKAELEQAYVFALPCIVEDNGNRDGIPNVIAEAMAMELPVISTRVSAIPELVEDGKHGYLLESGDFKTLAEKLQILFAQPELARKMGGSGRRRIQQIFSLDRCLKKLTDVFDEQVKI